jgi:hypothetical protein
MLRGRTYNEQVDVYSYAMCLLEVVDGEPVVAPLN